MVNKLMSRVSRKVLNKLDNNATYVKLKDIPGYLRNRKKVKDIYTPELLILDDIFPSLLSAFRVAEINSYLHSFDGLVLSTAKAFQYIKEKRSFEEVLTEYGSIYPEFENKVLPFNYFLNVRPQLIYVVFLHNAFNFLGYIEKLKTPFVFTLYPGGGFELHNDHCDKMLRAVFNSPYFREVVVTQKITYDYIFEKGFCDPEKANFIFGGVLPANKYVRTDALKQRYPENKKHIDICFVAVKLMEKGIDKGYDTFIETAKIICRQRNNVFFHVIGNYTTQDIDITGIEDRITFYGYLSTHQFSDFYKDKDIIISPNVPFVLTKGGFDGFPTGACVEASLNNVAMFVSDPLNMNNGIYKHNEDIVIIDTNPEAIAHKVLDYVENPQQLYKLALAGMEKNRAIFSLENQISPRLNILEKYIAQQHD